MDKSFLTNQFDSICKEWRYLAKSDDSATPVWGLFIPQIYAYLKKLANDFQLEYNVQINNLLLNDTTLYFYSTPLFFKRHMSVINLQQLTISIQRLNSALEYLTTVSQNPNIQILQQLSNSLYNASNILDKRFNPITAATNNNCYVGCDPTTTSFVIDDYGTAIFV